MEKINKELKNVNGGTGEIYYTYFIKYKDSLGNEQEFESSVYGDKEYCKNKLKEHRKELEHNGYTIIGSGIQIFVRERGQGAI